MPARVPAAPHDVKASGTRDARRVVNAPRYCFFAAPAAGAAADLPFDRSSTNAIIVFKSASLTCGFGGIGTWPHTPDPPFFTLSKSFAGALLSFLYFSDTSM